MKFLLYTIGFILEIIFLSGCTYKSSIANMKSTNESKTRITSILLYFPENNIIECTRSNTITVIITGIPRRTLAAAAPANSPTYAEKSMTVVEATANIVHLCPKFSVIIFPSDLPVTAPILEAVSWTRNKGNARNSRKTIRCPWY